MPALLLCDGDDDDDDDDGGGGGDGGDSYRILCSIFGGSSLFQMPYIFYQRHI